MSNFSKRATSLKSKPTRTVCSQAAKSTTPAAKPTVAAEGSGQTAAKSRQLQSSPTPPECYTYRTATGHKVSHLCCKLSSSSPARQSPADDLVKNPDDLKQNCLQVKAFVQGEEKHYVVNIEVTTPTPSESVHLSWYGLNSTLGYYRGKHDSANSIVAGGLSGMVFKSTRGLKPMMISGGIVASIAGGWAVSAFLLGSLACEFVFTDKSITGCEEGLPVKCWHVPVCILAPERTEPA